MAVCPISGKFCRKDTLSKLNPVFPKLIVFPCVWWFEKLVLKSGSSGKPVGVTCRMNSRKAVIKLMVHITVVSTLELGKHDI